MGGGVFELGNPEGRGAQAVLEKAGTKVGPDQLRPPVRVGSTRIDSDQLGSNKKIKIKQNWTRINSEQSKKIKLNQQN